MQRSYHLCAADCYRKHQAAAEPTMRACEQQCMMPVQAAQQALQAEMNSLQARLQRDIATCEDDARMAATSMRGADAERQAAMEASFAPCAVAAADSSLSRIETAIRPSLESRLKDLLKPAAEE